MYRLRTSAAVVAAVLSLVLVPMGSGLPEAAGSQEGTTWTVMIYMAGDADSSLPWEDDVNEMESAQASPSVKIVALVDPEGVGDSMLLEIVHDPVVTGDTIISPTIDDEGAVIVGGEVNTGSPTTLRNFVEFVVAEYPADNLALFLWGHGGGWLGLCPDGSDILTLPELRAALADATHTIGSPLDLVVVDACAEAVVETMYEIREHVDWFVASERGVPIAGLPYGWIFDALAFRPEMSVPAFGKIVADEYGDWAWFYGSYSVSMAVFDLRAMPAFIEDFSELAIQGLRFERLFHDDFDMSYTLAETYEMANYVDVGDFVLQLLVGDIPLEMRDLARKTLFSYAEFVHYARVYSHPDPVDGVTMLGATGAVVYFPSSDTVASGYSSLRLSETMWDEFAVAVLEGPPSELSEPAPGLSYRDSDDDGQADEAHLAWSASYTTVSAFVFRDGPDGLVHDSSFTGTANRVIIWDVVGSLIVSASAFVEDECVSYHILDVSLSGGLEVWVEVRHLGEQVDFKHNVLLVSSTGVHPFEAVGSWFLCVLEVPSSAEVGERLTVVVRDASSGETVAVAWTVLERDGATVVVEVFEPEEDGISWLWLVPALIPAIVILLAAVVVARRARDR
jgi:hypothetical protein